MSMAATGSGATPERQGTDMVALTAILVTIVFWASAFAVIRTCLEALTPVELATARYIAAAIIAAAYLAIARPALPARSDVPRLIVAAILFIAAYAVLLNMGERTVAAGPASFIINTMPVMTALIAMVMLGERFGRWGWIGTAISFAGVTLIALSGSHGFDLDPNAILIIGAALCSAVGSVLQKPILGRMPALAVTAWLLLIGAIPLIPALPMTVQALLEAPAAVNWSLVYLVLFPTAVGYATWAIALKRLAAARAANFLYGVPPMATLIGFIWLGEVPTLIGAIGGGMAICGVLVVNVMRKR